MALHGVLNVTCTAERGRTEVQNIYFTPPFKVMKPFWEPSRNQLEILLMECSPGLLAGDRQQMEVVLRPGARLKVTSQSYGKIMTMTEGEARQDVTLRVGAEASLIWMLEPLVPYQGSAFVSVQRVELERGSRLFWCEMLTPGRTLNSEVFLYRKYQSRLEVRLDGELIAWDQLRLVPEEQELRGLGVFEGYTHYAQVLVIADEWQGLNLQELLSELRPQGHDLQISCSALWQSGWCIRIVGRSAESVRTFVHRIAGRFQEEDNA